MLSYFGIRITGGSSGGFVKLFLQRFYFSGRPVQCMIIGRSAAYVKGQSALISTCKWVINGFAFDGSVRAQTIMTINRNGSWLYRLGILGLLEVSAADNYSSLLFSCIKGCGSVRSGMGEG